MRMGSASLRAAAFGVFVASGIISSARVAHAAGFALREGSADWMANAFAGDAAKAYDAATVWSNPAGMVRLNQSEFDGSVNGIFPNIKFEGANYFGATSTASGATGGNLIQAAATGGTYAVWSFSPDLKFGIGADAPFGQRISNPGNFVGRYQSLNSAVTDIAVTLAFAYRINDQFSVGGGPVVDYFSTRSTAALNTGPTAALTGDPVADVHGDDVSAGFNIGGMYQATSSLRFGLDYHSRIQHGITGSQSISIPPLISLFSPQTAALLAAGNSTIREKITLPDNLTGGVYFQLTPQLALLSDVEWTDWSVFKSVNVTPTTPGVPGTVVPFSFHSAWAVSVGANYRVLDNLMLQTGVGYDQTPVRAAVRTSRVPDSDRYLVSAGLQYDVLPNLTLQVAYSHVFFATAVINNAASTTSGQLVGKYTSSADTASLGVKYKF